MRASGGRTRCQRTALVVCTDCFSPCQVVRLKSLVLRHQMMPEPWMGMLLATLQERYSLQTLISTCTGCLRVSVKLSD